MDYQISSDLSITKMQQDDCLLLTSRSDGSLVIVLEEIPKLIEYLKEFYKSKRISGYAGPSEHGTYPGHERGCTCGLCESVPMDL